MVSIPDDVVTAADLAEWYQLKAELGRIKSKEALLRSRIFKFYFPVPTEGTNSADINDGTGAVVKGTHVINRSVDIGALDALKEQQKVEGSNAPKINLDELVKWKPEVSISAYRELTEEEQHFFDQCLIIKPGSPQLEITIPKRAKAGGTR
jgi:hypothetical protein